MVVLAHDIRAYIYTEKKKLFECCSYTKHTYIRTHEYIYKVCTCSRYYMCVYYGLMSACMFFNICVMHGILYTYYIYTNENAYTENSYISS